jgi:hypothetical protein
VQTAPHTSAISYFISPGISSVLAMVTKAVWTFPTQKDK